MLEFHLQQPLQAACGLINKPKDLISDIDVTDIDNELAVVEYVDDIYKFYKLTEVMIFSVTFLLICLWLTRNFSDTVMRICC